ncbi:MAG: DUF2283 domain-containing protein [Planctomycetes bacterium]|nr:DUF2283 domain-containing protein [Planctomycetota bacterium]
MKARYDVETDTLVLILRDGRVVESDEPRPGVILDFDGDGQILSVEILDASRRVENPRAVTLVTTG